MSLLQKLKSTLGLGGSRSRRGAERGGEVGVTVEHEPDAATEAAVKGSDGGEKAADERASNDEERSIGDDEAAVAAEAAEEEESEPAEGEGGTDVPVDDLAGIGPAYAERLGDAGVETVADLADADAATLAEDADIAESRIERWIEQAVAEY